MNFTKENIDQLNAVVKVKLGPEDYQSKVDTTLKNYQKKANMPGFRPGKVPAGMIKKMYGKSVLVDEINKLLSDSLYKYISENNLEILGNPLPKAEEELIIDWDNQKEFEFAYDLGLAPQFTVKFSEKDSFIRHMVRIDDKMLDEHVINISKRYGKVTHPEVSEKEDLLFGDVAELDKDGNILAGGVFKTSSIALDRLKNDRLRQQFTGLKTGDKIILQVAELVKEPVDVSMITGLDNEKAKTVSSDFQFTVNNVGRLEPAELSQEFFDKLYGSGQVNSVEEFRNKIASELKEMFAADSDRRLKNDIVEALMNKINVSLPDEFLKRWLLMANEKPVTAEQVSAEYNHYSKGLKWQLIENKIIKDHQLKVSNEEVMDYARNMIRQQFIKYNQPDVSDEVLESTVKKVFENKDEAKKIYDQLYDSRIMDLFKKSFTITEKETSYDEFYKAEK